MNPTLRNILAVVAGLVLGSIINMGIINLGHMILPIEGLDTNDMESFADVFPTLSAEYFVFPFLGHAIGTFIGAIITAKIAATQKMRMALIVGVLFLIGGIVAAYLIPAPIRFVVVDLAFAYLPMAWLGGNLGGRK